MDEKTAAQIKALMARGFKTFPDEQLPQVSPLFSQLCATVDGLITKDETEPEPETPKKK